MTFKKITSASNPLVKEVLKIKERKAADRHDFLIEGQHLFEMAVGASAQIKQVFFTSQYRVKYGPFPEGIPEKGCEYIETTEHVLSRLSDTETPQGIAAVVSYKAHGLGDISLRANPLLVVCDGIRDPGNLGTIIRTSDAFGAHAVVLLPGTCDALAPKVVRASAGSIFNVPVLSAGQEELLGWLQAKKINLIVTDTNADRIIYEADLLNPVAFVFGNEGAGVGPDIKERREICFRVPMPGRAESLNVAVCAAIALYEAFRQRRSRT